MNIFLVIFLVLLFVLIGRISFILAIKRDSAAHHKFRKLLALHNLYLLNPLVGKRTYFKYGIAMLLSVIAGVLFYFIINSFYLYNLANLTIFIHVAFVFSALSLLLYLAIYDLLYYEIPIQPVYSFLGLVIVFNIFSALISVISAERIFILGNPANLLSGITLGLIFYVVVKLTKEQGMGMGDVYLMLAVGLSLGISRSITAYLLTLLLASIFGILVSFAKRKFHRTLIPLVPFIFLGFSLSLAISESFISIFRLF